MDAVSLKMVSNHDKREETDQPISSGANYYWRYVNNVANNVESA